MRRVNGWLIVFWVAMIPISGLRASSRLPGRPSEKPTTNDEQHAEAEETQVPGEAFVPHVMDTKELMVDDPFD